MVDERTNKLFAHDTPSRLDDLRRLITEIDIPMRQVMIEARIVEAADSFSKDLGVRLGLGGVRLGVGGGNVSGSIVGGGTLDNSADGIPKITNAYNVNLPAVPRSGSAGSLAFTLFNSAQTQFLGLEISALEADGRGKVVSSPRVVTADQVEAIIEQGVEIPYQQATASGATSVSFKKANLSLKVKPHITPDGKITLSVDVNKDTPNTRVQTGVIAIDTKHVKTEVLVENGGTVVIGGIYQQESRESVSRIPVLGEIPYLGWLFRNKQKIDDKSELLVFITPRIVSEAMSIR
jgi:type IV pilus assembly protein PilQ